MYKKRGIIYAFKWSPYVPRNLILRYSKPNELVLDQFVGSGTTLVEAKLLNRKAIGIDINKDSITLAFENLQFDISDTPEIMIREGDYLYLKNKLLVKRKDIFVILSVCKYN